MQLRTATRRGPGRPARLSRQAILDAVVALLEREPSEALTVARIAAEVGAVPAALYRHFASFDVLLDGVVAALLGSIDVAIDRSAHSNWQGQLREWLTSLRKQLVRHPAVLSLVGHRARTSPAWLDVVAPMVGILERAGLRDDVLAKTHLWVLEMAIGIVAMEVSMPVPEQIRNARASLASMSSEGRQQFEPIVPHLAQLDGDSFFAFAIERTIAAIEALSEQPDAAQPGQR